MSDYDRHGVDYRKFRETQNQQLASFVQDKPIPVEAMQNQPVREAPTTGLKFDTEKAPLSLLSTIWLTGVAQVMGFGAKKVRSSQLAWRHCAFAPHLSRTKTHPSLQHRRRPRSRNRTKPLRSCIMLPDVRSRTSRNASGFR